jgi:hypothetical protein
VPTSSIQVCGCCSGKSTSSLRNPSPYPHCVRSVRSMSSMANCSRWPSLSLCKLCCRNKSLHCVRSAPVTTGGAGGATACGGGGGAGRGHAGHGAQSASENCGCCVRVGAWIGSGHGGGHGKQSTAGPQFLHAEWKAARKAPAARPKKMTSATCRPQLLAPFILQAARLHRTVPVTDKSGKKPNNVSRQRLRRTNRKEEPRKSSLMPLTIIPTGDHYTQWNAKHTY